MCENYETIEIDIPDDVFMELARAAHEKNITLNEFICQILQDYVDGKIGIPEDPLEVKLRESVVDVVTNGVTIETLKNFAHSYVKWFEESSSQTKFFSDIIQDGFNEADNESGSGGEDAGRT